MTPFYHHFLTILVAFMKKSVCFAVDMPRTGSHACTTPVTEDHRTQQTLAVVALPIFGQNAKLATSRTCNDKTLGPIAVLGVIDPGSGYTVALGKLLRGGLGSRVERNTVRKVDQNGRNGQRRDSNTRRPWPRRAMIGWLQPTKTTLTTSVPIMGFINGDLLRYIFDTWAEKALFDDLGLTGDHQR